MEPCEVAAYWEANAESWTRFSRAGCDVYRDALNTPAFLAMLPPVDGLLGLDIGCGEGTNTRQLVRLGAHMSAIDVAPSFVRYAREAEAAQSSDIDYEIADALELPFPDGSFDFATAFMSLMDVSDPARAVREAARVLRPGGFLQFSILHPCFAPPYRKVVRNDDGTTRAIEIARYFDPVDGEIETWCFSSLPPEAKRSTEPFRIPRFHRTLSQWVEMIVTAGLVIEAFGEPSASPEVAAAVPYVEDTRVAPLFLHVCARKPAGAPATPR